MRAVIIGGGGLNWRCRFLVYMVAMTTVMLLYTYMRMCFTRLRTPCKLQLDLNINQC